MTVHNLGGTQGPHYRKIGLPEWMAFKRRVVKPSCSVLGCGEKATDGGHVSKFGSTDHSWYICPLCHKHNEETGYLELKADWNDRLVPLTSL